MKTYSSGRLILSPEAFDFAFALEFSFDSELGWNLGRNI
jgi:hypothetical protein